MKQKNVPSFNKKWWKVYEGIDLIQKINVGTKVKIRVCQIRFHFERSSDNHLDFPIFFKFQKLTIQH